MEEEEIEKLEEIEEEHIQDLLAVRDIIATHRYLSHDVVGAGMHEIDILEAYIYQYPETAFLAVGGIWDAGSDAGLEAGAEPEATSLEGGGYGFGTVNNRCIWTRPYISPKRQKKGHLRSNT